MARKPKAAKRPAVERIPNILNVQSTQQEIAGTRARIVDADKKVQDVLSIFPDLNDEQRNKIHALANTEDTFKVLHEQGTKLGRMLKVAVSMLTETGNVDTLNSLANAMIAANIFPRPEDSAEKIAECHAEAIKMNQEMEKK